ncbi:hypothetical protein G3I44_14410 [Halogeometricum borinquense]|uniref:Uncharacterized protein n=1 Tax=Halogeometricum borinquense TaxID=60847 RepID=A0A6C0UNA6_9EURY|nr:hypothetical protein [Halogeometricum borinquense]QIB75379.1 hypothetical protein G3I44_14410 [Halogeometricum borinquense]
MVKEDFTFDAFYGAYHGGFTQDYNQTSRGKHPFIRLMGLPRKKEFPFPLQDKNIIRIEAPEGSTVRILRPTDDVPRVNMERTIWHALMNAVGEQAQDQSSQVEQLKKQLTQKDKRIRDLEEKLNEREERNRTTESTGLQCPSCLQNHGRDGWKNNDGQCPDCGTKHPKFKEGN